MPRLLRSARLLRVLVLLALCLGGAGPRAAQAQGPNISLQVDVRGPESDGTYHVSGSVVAGGLHPEGEVIVGNYVKVWVEYMIVDNGQWPVFYEYKNLADVCYAIGNHCLTSEEMNGVGVERGGYLWWRDLVDDEDGQIFTFETDIHPGATALQARVVAQLDHSATTPVAHHTAHTYYWSWARWDITLPPPPTATAGPPPTATPLPSATPTPLPAGAPSIYISDPQDGHVVLAPPGQPAAIDVHVQVSDPDGDLRELVLLRYSTIDTHQDSFATRPSGGNYVFNVPLQPGDNQVEVQASDQAGHLSTAGLQITLNQPGGGNPTSTPRPTDPPTPTPTPTPPQRDLKVEKVLPLQAVEGGNLVTARDVGVRVFLSWNDPSLEPLVEVVLRLDGTPVASKQQKVKAQYSDDDKKNARDSVNLVIDKAHLTPPQWWQDKTYTLEAEAQLIDGTTESDYSNNSLQQPMRTYGSTGLTLLYVSMDSSIGQSALNQFAAQVKPFMEQVYPILGLGQAPGAYRVSPYISNVWIARWLSGEKAIEKARRLYNSERCRDPQGKPLPSCDKPYADIAVGVFPEGAYGNEIHGFASKLLRHDLRAAANCQDHPQNTAHEIGHLYGLDDEYGTGIGKWITGLSIWRDGQFLYVKGAGQFYNLMGEAGLYNQDKIYTWVDPPTWNALLNELGVPLPGAGLPRTAGASAPAAYPRPAAEIEGEALLVSGLVDAQGQVLDLRVDLLQRYQPDLLPPGDFELAALDEAGRPLAAVPFGLTYTDEYGLEAPLAPFMVNLPLPAGAQAAQVRLSQSGQVLGSVVRSPNAPTVSFDPLPAIGSDPVTVSWQAADPDGDALRSTLLFSPDGGQVWQVLGLDLEGSSQQVDPAVLSGRQARFRVVVSDGLQEAEALSEPIDLPERAPQAVITLPRGDTFSETVFLNGYGFDLQEGALPPAQLNWQDEHGQSLGWGSELELSGLQPGSYRIVLRAENRAGQVGQDEVTITVQETPSGSAVPGPQDGWGLLAAALLAIGSTGVLLGVVWRRCLDAALVAIHEQGMGLRRQIQAGQVHPTQVQALQAHDRRGRWWSFDPRQNLWYRWTGKTWRQARPRQGRRWDWLVSGLLALALGAAALFVWLGWIQM